MRISMFSSPGNPSGLHGQHYELQLYLNRQALEILARRGKLAAQPHFPSYLALPWGVGSESEA
jgi:hypothetical protein